MFCTPLLGSYDKTFCQGLLGQKRVHLFTKPDFSRFSGIFERFLSFTYVFTTMNMNEDVSKREEHCDSMCQFAMYQVNK